MAHAVVIAVIMSTFTKVGKSDIHISLTNKPDAVAIIDQVIDFLVWRELDVKTEPKQMILNNWIMQGGVNVNQA